MENSTRKIVGFVPVYQDERMFWSEAHATVNDDDGCKLGICTSTGAHLQFSPENKQLPKCLVDGEDIVNVCIGKSGFDVVGAYAIIREMRDLYAPLAQAEGGRIKRVVDRCNEALKCLSLVEEIKP